MFDKRPMERLTLRIEALKAEEAELRAEAIEQAAQNALFSGTKYIDTFGTNHAWDNWALMKPDDLIGQVNYAADSFARFGEVTIQIEQGQFSEILAGRRSRIAKQLYPQPDMSEKYKDMFRMYKLFPVLASIPVGRHGENILEPLLSIVQTNCVTFDHSPESMLAFRLRAAELLFELSGHHSAPMVVQRFMLPALHTLEALNVGQEPNQTLIQGAAAIERFLIEMENPNAAIVIAVAACESPLLETLPARIAQRVAAPAAA